MNSSFARRAEIAFLVLLTLASLGVRLYGIGSNSLAEDEAAKWRAVQRYQQGHFAGVNSEHPMLLKLLAWAGLELGSRWSPLAARHDWPQMSQEGWLRLPNLLLGAATPLILYLLGRQMMGAAGAGAAAVFWAFTPLPVALNRILKEDTPLVFFTLLALYFFWKAKKNPEEEHTRRWVNLSGASFGLALASKYLPYFFGLNALAWHVAGREGLDRRPILPHLGRLFGVMGLVFVMVNPVVLSPANLASMWHYAAGTDIPHSGYNLDGRLYSVNPAFTPFGLPWYFYLWVLAVKTPLPVLAALLAGIVLLLRDRKTMASIFFRSFFLIQLLGLSVVAPKWMRYTLSLLPFAYLAAGYAVQTLYDRLLAMRGGRVARPAMAFAAVIFLAWPIAATLAWAPHYGFYLNAVGGGRANVARFFPHDEIYDLDAREEAQIVCRSAPQGATLGASNPWGIAYYLEQCGRGDIQVSRLYDLNYVPRNGDFIIVADSRRYWETQDLFSLLRHWQAPHEDIRVEGVLTSQVYRFDPASHATLNNSGRRAPSVSGKPLFVKARGTRWTAIRQDRGAPRSRKISQPGETTASSALPRTTASRETQLCADCR